MEAAARPLPSDETTPPVTKMYLVGRLSMEFTAPVVGCVRGRPSYSLRQTRTPYALREFECRARARAIARAVRGSRAALVAAARAGAASRGERHKGPRGCVPPAAPTRRVHAEWARAKNTG